MPQPHIIKLVSKGDENGRGKGHVYYSRKNRKQNPDKLVLKKYNPIADTHTEYEESKKL